MMESTEEIGFHVFYSPVSPAGPLNRFRDRAQDSLPDLRSKSKRFVRVLSRPLSMRVSLNAWPQAPRDDNQFTYLVLGSRDRGDKTRKNPFRAQLAAGHLRGPQPDSQLDGQNQIVSRRPVSVKHSPCPAALSADWGK